MPADEQVRTSRRTDRVPGLDSLRALGVIAVVGYHLGAPFFGGGFLGVTLFFVLSGYLITRLLLTEIETRGTADIAGFWVRRLRRLLPAAYVVVVVCLAGSMIFAPDLLTKVRGDGFASLFYASNWWTIFHDVSYFDSYGLPSPLAHLWTLAIEEQFYVVWPLALLALVVIVRKRTAILAIVGAAIIASVVLMATTYSSVDPNRSYMGTDTRMGELLLGAFLALALHPAGDGYAHPVGRVTAILESRRAWLALICSSGAFVLLAMSLPDTSAFAFRGGILLAALASAGMLLSLQAPAVSRVAVRVDAGVAGALGRRSYSVYLWHYPVLVALSTAQEFGRYSPGRSIAVVVITLLCAEVSYRVIEGPVQRLGLRRAVGKVTAGIRSLPQRWRRPAFVFAVSPMLLACLALAGVNAPSPQHDEPSSVVTGAEPVGSDISRSLTGPAVAGGQHARRSRRPDPAAPLVGRDTVAVGDSIMIDIAPLLGSEAPRITINAEVGRQPWTGLDIARSYAQFNRPGGNYILGIGTNGAIDAEALARFCDEHATARIFLITPRVNRSWESTSVGAIEAVARKYANVRVVDFHHAAAGHPDYFASDGVHLTADGTRAMVNLILSAATEPA
jgi:peptidoglycan/LPS O-acetylase OafA/YrhL